MNILAFPFDILSVILQYIAIMRPCKCFKSDLILVFRNVSRMWRIKFSVFCQEQFKITDQDLETYILLRNEVSNRIINSRHNNHNIYGRYDPLRLQEFAFGNEYNLKIKNPEKLKNINFSNQTTFTHKMECYICHENWQLDNSVFNCTHSSHKCLTKGCNNHIYVSECRCTYGNCMEHAQCNKTKKPKTECKCCFQGIRHECYKDQNGYHFTANLPLKQIIFVDQSLTKTECKYCFQNIKHECYKGQNRDHFTDTFLKRFFDQSSNEVFELLETQTLFVDPLLNEGSVTPKIHKQIFPKYDNRSHKLTNRNRNYNKQRNNIQQPRKY